MSDDKFGIESGFIYRPPIYSPECLDATIQPIRYIGNQITNEKWILNLRETLDQTCPSCDAMDLLHKIYDLGENPDLFVKCNLLEKAIIFILENVDWKTESGDNHEQRSAKERSNETP